MVTFDLEIDAINAPKRKVTVSQAMFGEAYKNGERIYLLVDPDDPASIALMPLSALGNQHLPQGANRLDANVLGPQVLHEGAKAEGTILSATQIPVATPQLAAAGFSRYHLRVHTCAGRWQPRYDAEQDIGFSTSGEGATHGYSRRHCADSATTLTTRNRLSLTVSRSGIRDPYEAAKAAMQAAIAKA